MRLTFQQTVLGAGCLLAMTTIFAQTTPAQLRDRFTIAREAMVDEFLVQEGITNRRVLSALRSVPRHEFVNRLLRNRAYEDIAMPIGDNQTISPPFIVAYMTETIDPQPTDKVLEIGTGSGYQAAVLSGLVKEVYSIEIKEGLGRSAKVRLKKLNYDNVFTLIGDGYKGWPEHAPFDKIIVTCSPEKVPQPLVQQLKEGGKMIIPLGERYQQVFHLLEKKDGKLVQKKLIPTLFVPMTGASEDKRQEQPDPLRPKIVNGGFENDTNKDGRADNWHYQRQTRIATDADAPEGKACLCFTNLERGRVSQALQGTAIDGRSVGKLKFDMAIRYENTRPGLNRREFPGLVVHFYDASRKPVGDVLVGQWLDTQSWRVYSREIPVPRNAREMIFRIGLNGGTGTLYIDALQVTPIGR